MRVSATLMDGKSRLRLPPEQQYFVDMPTPRNPVARTFGTDQRAVLLS